jgi:hypothetical protein
MIFTKSNNTYFATPKNDVKDKISLEVGDSKQPDFKPQQKIIRWDNEVNVSLRLVHDEVSPTVSKSGEKIIWEGEKVKAEIYPITEGDGGQEFEISLKVRPKSNVVQFTLVDKGVDYFYQTEFTQEEKDNGFYQPDNVIGSYAIYTKENKINYVGDKEYKNGKVGHIYRPRIEDSDGNCIWGELNIEKGILSVTIPQDFLDKAVYPVRHAAGLTFGYTSIGTGSSLISKNTTIYHSIFASAGAGTIDSISFASKRYNSSYHPSGKAIIASSSGTLLTNGVSNATSSDDDTAQFRAATMSTPPSVSASTNYILGTIFNDFAFQYLDVQATTGGSVGSNSYTTPTNFTPNLSNQKYSIYATYTPPAAPTVTTQAVSSISYTTATGNGNVTADGGATVTEQGICWKTSTGPTTADSKVVANETSTTFTASITGLTANTLYYVKAYAINSVGTSYGSEVTFTSQQYQKIQGISSIQGISTLQF